MSKILNSVLEKVSENNNEYRALLRDLNVKIDEKTTAFVGDVVTASGYTVDFSNAITSAKEKIVNPVSRIVESYVIKDLRSVETVNEQFVEKQLYNKQREQKPQRMISVNTSYANKFFERC